MFIALLIIFVLSMITCHIVAKRKNRNPVAWGVTGGVLGPIGILLILLLPDKSK